MESKRTNDLFEACKLGGKVLEDLLKRHDKEWGPKTTVTYKGTSIWDYLDGIISDHEDCMVAIYLTKKDASIDYYPLDDDDYTFNLLRELDASEDYHCLFSK
jgi:hypothetical protein